jgi:methylase of polypeptide subunit release factors
MALFTPHGNPYFEYRLVLSRAKTSLKAGGRLFLEVGDKRAQDVAQLGQESGFKLIRIVKDLGGVERLIELERP